MESGHIKVDQMRKHYDFKIKGAKVFGACNEISRLSRPESLSILFPNSPHRSLYHGAYSKQSCNGLIVVILVKDTLTTDQDRI